MAENNDIDSLDKKPKKQVKTKTVIPVKEEKKTPQYSTSSNVVLDFITSHKEDIGNKAIVPSPEVSCLDCLFARWRKETDNDNQDFLQCYCKDLNMPIWSGAFQNEVTSCDGPEIAKALAKKI